MEYPSLGTPPAGSIRFNTDSSKMEIYNGEKWWEIDGRQASGRGLISNVGGEFANGISYVELATTGNAVDFGDLNYSKRRESCFSSTSRGIFAGGDESPSVDTIDFVTIASTGNATDFGNLTAASGMGSGCSNQTRGIVALGYVSPARVNTIDYITIAQTGNAVDYGDLTAAKNQLSSLASPTRGVFVGGSTGSNSDVIEFVTISSTGNAADFGNLLAANQVASTAGTATRGLAGGGGAGGSPNQYAYNVIQYVTIASLGDATDFGDLTVSRGQSCGLSNSTRVAFAGGVTDNGGNTASSVIDYVQASSTGDAVDFGDTNADTKRSQGCCGDSHGGLGGG